MAGLCVVFNPVNQSLRFTSQKLGKSEETLLLNELQFPQPTLGFSVVEGDQYHAGKRCVCF